MKCLISVNLLDSNLFLSFLIPLTWLKKSYVSFDVSNNVKYSCCGYVVQPQVRPQARPQVQPKARSQVSPQTQPQSRSQVRH